MDRKKKISSFTDFKENFELKTKNILSKNKLKEVSLISEKFNGILKIVKTKKFSNLNDYSNEIINKSKLSLIEHPNIITINQFYSFFNQSDLTTFEYIEVSEKFKGDLKSELNKRICSKKHFNSEEIFKISKDIENGLHHLHSKGIIHGNMNLGNILIKNDKEYILDDIQFIDNLQDYKEFIKRNKTIKIFPPESEKIIDSNDKNEINWKAIDIYALGICIFQLAALQTEDEVILKDHKQIFEYIPLLNCSEDIKEMISVMLEFDVRKRKFYQSLFLIFY